MELLISNGANLNAVSSYDDTPLSKAVRAGNEDAVELLVSKGTNVNTLDSFGRRYFFCIMKNLETKIAFACF